MFNIVLTAIFLWTIYCLALTYKQTMRLIDAWYSKDNTEYEFQMSLSSYFTKHFFALLFMEDWRNVYPEKVRRMIKAKGL